MKKKPNLRLVSAVVGLKRKILLSLIIFTVLFYLGFLSFKREEIGKATHQEIRAVFDQSFAKLNNTEISDKTLPTKTEIAILIKTIMDKSVESKINYRNALTEAGMDSLFDPDFLETDYDLNHSFTIINNMRSVIHEYEIKQKELINEIPQLVESSNIGRKVKSQFINEFQTNNRQNQLSNEFWRLEEASVDEMEVVLNFLKSNKEHWEIVDGYIVFESDELLFQFNQQNEKINKIFETQNKMEQDQIQKTRELLK